jgi:hypothetical protein
MLLAGHGLTLSADPQCDVRDTSNFCRHGFLELADIVIFHPTLEEAGRNGKQQLAI